MRFRIHALACGVFLPGLALLACNQKGDKANGTKAPAKTGTTVEAPTQKKATSKDAPPPSSAAAPKAEANAEQGTTSDVASPEDEPDTNYACDNDAIWETREYKALHDGQLQTIKEGVTLPAFSWGPCAGKDHCEKLSLSSTQKLLGVGQNGNTTSLAVAESCGENTSVLVGSGSGPARVALRGVDMVFETGALGGDRFLLGGYAKHKSEKARNGFTPREYLVTGREGAFAKLEPARNKKNSIPSGAASQFVQVKDEGQRCTTMFWKLGVEQCDFAGPSSDNSALIGGNMIFIEDGKAMKWNAKDGVKDLLPQADWVIGDGVNVAWAVNDELYKAQPRWDLPELKGSKVPGSAGERPLALGCGRALTRAGSSMLLRNLTLRTAWTIPESRIPTDAGDDVALGCDDAIFASGYRISFKSLGKPKPVATATPDENEDAPKTLDAAPEESDKAERETEEAPHDAPPTESEDELQNEDEREEGD